MKVGSNVDMGNIGIGFCFLNKTKALSANKNQQIRLFSSRKLSSFNTILCNF
ncbi:MAG: hypothetical protein Rpha_1986 [Candidatus Ruthia sp. Apha_13_S6]|nr:hypothetical protein [Candidatus Ruthia sp. Apha_13_S6]